MAEEDGGLHGGQRRQHASATALPLRAAQRRPWRFAGALHQVAHQVLDRLTEPGILGTEAYLSLVYVYVWGTEALPILQWTDGLCSTILNKGACI